LSGLVTDHHEKFSSIYCYVPYTVRRQLYPIFLADACPSSEVEGFVLSSLNLKISASALGDPCANRRHAGILSKVGTSQR
jgi:hypothetical protein